MYSNDETASRKQRAGPPQILQVCVVLAFECRARIAGSDKIRINSSSRSMFFSPILFPELIVSNEVFYPGRRVNGPEIDCSVKRVPLILSACSRIADGKIDSAPISKNCMCCRPGPLLLFNELLSPANWPLKRRHPGFHKTACSDNSRLCTSSSRHRLPPFRGSTVPCCCSEKSL